MKTHKDLDVWKRAMRFVTQIYTATNDFPKSEEFGLKSQIRRAAVSIAANIAEGAARQTKKEFIQFIYIGIGSLSEIETLLLISANLNLLKSEDFLAELETIRKMLFGLLNSLKMSMISEY
ncbi:MAG: four helix bundle protein [Candidatus Aminicenantales bacterium]